MSDDYAAAAYHLSGTDPQGCRLVEAILEFVLKKLEGRARIIDLESSGPTTSIPLPSSELGCVAKLLQQDPDHVYRFHAHKPDVHVPDRPSFTKLVEDWDTASDTKKEDGGSFPEIRKNGAANHFTQCVLSCMCDTCSKGEAVELFCKPRTFGHGEDAQEEVRNFSVRALCPCHC